MLGTPAVVKSVTETRQAGTAIIHAFIDRSVATFLDASSLHTYIYSTSPSSAFGTVKVNIHMFMELGLLFEDFKGFKTNVGFRKTIDCDKTNQRTARLSSRLSGSQPGAEGRRDQKGVQIPSHVPSASVLSV